MRHILIVDGVSICLDKKLKDFRQEVYSPFCFLSVVNAGDFAIALAKVVAWLERIGEHSGGS
ncbi:MAG: hypothetical protein C4334_09105 [Pyrinomonas sp.]